MTRNDARELVMQLAFEMQAQDEFGEDIRDRFFAGKDLGTQEVYAKDLAATVADNREEIDSRLAKCSENWKVGRMNKADLAILRVAAAEILYCDEIPDAVSINEAVELAKKFGGETSPKFVNGVLGKLVKQK